MTSLQEHREHLVGRLFLLLAAGFGIMRGLAYVGNQQPPELPGALLQLTGTGIPVEFWAWGWIVCGTISLVGVWRCWVFLSTFVWCASLAWGFAYLMAYLQSATDPGEPTNRDYVVASTYLSVGALGVLFLLLWWLLVTKSQAALTGGD